MIKKWIKPNLTIIKFNDINGLIKSYACSNWTVSCPKLGKR